MDFFQPGFSPGCVTTGAGAGEHSVTTLQTQRAGHRKLRHEGPWGHGDSDSALPQALVSPHVPSEPAAQPQGRTQCSLTFLLLIVVPLPKAHVDFRPRLRLFNHSSLHTDEIFP